MGKLKVWGTIVHGPGGQHRAVIATSNVQQAAAAFGHSLHHMRQFASITGNQQEVKAAMSKPGAVFWRSVRGPHDKPYLERDQGCLTQEQAHAAVQQYLEEQRHG